MKHTLGLWVKKAITATRYDVMYNDCIISDMGSKNDALQYAKDMAFRYRLPFLGFKAAGKKRRTPRAERSLFKGKYK